MASVARGLRGVFISPEITVLLALVYLTLNPPSFVTQLARVMAHGPEAVKYIAILPACIFVWSLAEAKNILLPGEDTKAVLVNWPRYADLRVRVVTGLCYEALFTTISFIAWVYSPQLSNPFCLVAAVMGVIGGIVSGGTFFLGSVMVRSIVKRASA